MKNILASLFLIALVAIPASISSCRFETPSPLELYCVYAVMPDGMERNMFCNRGWIDPDRLRESVKATFEIRLRVINNCEECLKK